MDKKMNIFLDGTPEEQERAIQEAVKLFEADIEKAKKQKSSKNTC